MIDRRRQLIVKLFINVSLQSLQKCRRIEGLDLYKAKAEEREKLQAREVKTLQDELTKTKHTLHEQETRARRLHRDNVELHKKLQVKSSELNLLEDQTHTFEAEMGKLTKSIHTIQSGVQQEAESTTDYELLFKKQQEQRDRMEAESTNAVTNAAAKTCLSRGCISPRPIYCPKSLSNTRLR